MATKSGGTRTRRARRRPSPAAVARPRPVVRSPRRARGRERTLSQFRHEEWHCRHVRVDRRHQQQHGARVRRGVRPGREFGDSATGAVGQEELERNVRCPLPDGVDAVPDEHVERRRRSERLRRGGGEGHDLRAGGSGAVRTALGSGGGLQSPGRRRGDPEDGGREGRQRGRLVERRERYVARLRPRRRRRPGERLRRPGRADPALPGPTVAGPGASVVGPPGVPEQFAITPSAAFPAPTCLHRRRPERRHGGRRRLGLPGTRHRIGEQRQLHRRHDARAGTGVTGSLVTSARARLARGGLSRVDRGRPSSRPAR